MRASVVLAGSVVVLALAGCEGKEGPTPIERIQVAKAYRADGEYRSAVIELKNLLQKRPDHAEARWLLGRTYLRLGQAPAAEKELDRALRLGIDPVAIMAPLSEALLLQNAYEAVLERIEVPAGADAALKGEIRLARVKALLGLGRVADAEETLAGGGAEVRQTAAWAFGKALLAFYQGDREAAVSWNQRAMARDPERTETLALEGDLAVMAGDYQEGLRLFRRAVEQEPAMVSYQLALARTHLLTDKPAEAAERLDKVLADFPNHRYANHLRAVAALRSQDYETALAHAETAIGDRGALMSSLVAAASAYALGQFESAYSHIETVAERAPRDRSIQQLAAAIELELGQVEQAAERLAEAEADGSPSDNVLLSAVGMTALRAGQANLAVEVLQKAAAREPDNPRQTARLGLARLSRGDIDLGVEDLERSLEMRPGMEGSRPLLILGYLRAGKVEAARREARKFVDANPGNPDAHILMGLVHGTENRLDQALEWFNRALAMRPGDPNAAFNAASIALERGDVNQARSLYSQVVKHHPENQDALLRLARVEFVQGDREQAVSRVRQAIEAHPEAAAPRAELARFQLARGDAEAALGTVRDGLGRTPDDLALRTLEGRALVSVGQPAEAASRLEGVVEAIPEDVSARFLLAWAYSRDGRLPKARDQINRVLQRVPDATAARVFKAEILARLGELEQAESLLVGLREDHPDEPAVHRLRGEVALAKGETTEAIEAFRQARSQMTNNFLTIRLAQVYEYAGERERSRELLRQWLDQHPRDVMTRGVLADALLGEGRFGAARDHYEQMVEQVSGHVSAHNNLAWAALQMDDLDIAEHHAERARELAPEEPQVMDTLALVRLKQGQAREAIRLLRGAVRKAEGDVGLRLHLAQALAAAGNDAQARTLLKELLAVDSPFPGRAQAEELLTSIEQE